MIENRRIFYYIMDPKEVVFFLMNDLQSLDLVSKKNETVTKKRRKSP